VRVGLAEATVRLRSEVGLRWYWWALLAAVRAPVVTVCTHLMGAVRPEVGLLGEKPCATEQLPVTLRASHSNLHLFMPSTVNFSLLRQDNITT